MKKLFIPIILLFILLGCDNKKGRNELQENEQPKSGGTLTLVLHNDLDFLNPVLAADITKDAIQDLVFPSALEVVWNENTGLNEFKPYFANSWSFSNNGKDLTYNLKNDMYWEDGNKVTPGDLLFTFKLCSDPIAASQKQFNMIYFFKDKSGKIDIDKSIEIMNDTAITFHFTKNYPSQIIHTNLKFIPKHYFQDVNVKTLANDERNFKPISAGPYKLEKWEADQYLIFNKNPNYKLPDKPNIDRLIFKILPEYTSRLTALKNREVDFVYAINADDVQSLKANYPEINIIPLIGTYYDCVNWSNIDNQYYTRTKKIRPHPLFGNKIVRKALTMAINRNEIIRAFLGSYGQLCSGPVSPIFKWAYNSNIKPYEYNPDYARKILDSLGWKDSNGDGVLEKDGRDFKFTLYINAGSARKEYTANVIKDNLKKIGIEVTIEKMEWTTFQNDIAKRKIDVFINSLRIPSDFNLSDFWNSDLEKASQNDPGFQNKRVDELMSLIDNQKDILEAAPYIREFQEIIHEEEPCSFLFWWANIIGVNKRVQNVKSNIWDPYNHIWEWWLKN